ncbi:MAG: Ppx/GppA family phosphatase [Candidatus Binataceae bacterium]
MIFAALDVGTNTTLMLVAEAENNAVHPLAEMSRITRLGRGVDSNHMLDATAAARTADAITDFAQRARELGARKFLSAATSALRDAGNGAEFVAEVKRRAGLNLEIISGETEAELCHLAAIKGLELELAAKMLIVDIGGGSTELIRCEPGRKVDLTSPQIGSVRLSERLVHHDPPSAREGAELRVTIDQSLRDMQWDFEPDVMVGIAGTVVTVCAVALGLASYDAKIVHGHHLPQSEVLRVLARFGAVTLEERREIPGLEEGRADVIFAGTAILERVMGHFDMSEVIVSDQGVRWGLVWRALESLQSHDQS